MSNEKVIEKFLKGEKGNTPTRDILNGCFTYKGQTLKANGKELINYQTKIAYKKGKKVFLNIKRYSVTTSKIQSKIRFLASQQGFEIVEFMGV